MIESANFAALVDKAMILSGRGHMRPVIKIEVANVPAYLDEVRRGMSVNPGTGNQFES
jgi:hypothetical protein